jgi:D-sedoheptulose 7-phosphate isomerase
MTTRKRSEDGGSGGPLEREARAILRSAWANLARIERLSGRAVAEAAEAMIACLEGGGTVFFCGNGGSAADSQHLACELAGRFMLDRPALAAVALSTNTSSLTAIGNDFGYEHVFARQLEGLGSPGDVLVAITTSGASPNVRRAVATAHALGMTVIALTSPKGRRFASSCDLAILTPGTTSPRIQEGHIMVGHALCELVERALFGAGRSGRARTRRAPAARRRRSRSAPRR